jgi:hypothetical protein
LDHTSDGARNRNDPPEWRNFFTGEPDVSVVLSLPFSKAEKYVLAFESGKK